MKAPLTAAGCGLALCHTCGLLSPMANGHDCSRCGAPLHLRKPDSINRAWALLIAACVLYVPANLLPIMETRSLFGTQQDTIMSGVIYLWSSGSWPLAVIVFLASIMTPLMKLLSLAVLLSSAQKRMHWQPVERTKLYRVLELIGRWSMLDVYVVTILVALVQVQSLATMLAGPGALAFGAVVVLSMLAAMAFDPRLIWDPLSASAEEKN